MYIHVLFPFTHECAWKYQRAVWWPFSVHHLVPEADCLDPTRVILGYWVFGCLLKAWLQRRKGESTKEETPWGWLLIVITVLIAQCPVCRVLCTYQLSRKRQPRTEPSGQGWWGICGSLKCSSEALGGKSPTAQNGCPYCHTLPWDRQSPTEVSVLLLTWDPEGLPGRPYGLYRGWAAWRARVREPAGLGSSNHFLPPPRLLIVQFARLISVLYI